MSAINLKRILMTIVVLLIVYYANSAIRFINIEYSIDRFNWGTEGEYEHSYFDIIKYQDDALPQLLNHINISGDKPFMEERGVFSCIRSITGKNLGFKFDVITINDGDTLFYLDPFYNDLKYDSIKVEALKYVKSHYKIN